MPNLILGGWKMETSFTGVVGESVPYDGDCTMKNLLRWDYSDRINLFKQHDM